MISRYKKSIGDWLKRAAELALAWLKQHCPESWQESLDNLDELQIDRMIQAGCDLVNRHADMIIFMLVVYFLAPSSLLGMLLMAIMGLGLVLAMNHLADQEGQQA
jgi:hypothetical protein